LLIQYFSGKVVLYVVFYYFLRFLFNFMHCINVEV